MEGRSQTTKTRDNVADFKHRWGQLIHGNCIRLFRFASEAFCRRDVNDVPHFQVIDNSFSMRLLTLSWKSRDWAGTGLGSIPSLEIAHAFWNTLVGEEPIAFC